MAGVYLSLEPGNEGRVTVFLLLASITLASSHPIGNYWRYILNRSSVPAPITALDSVIVGNDFDSKVWIMFQARNMQKTGWKLCAFNMLKTIRMFGIAGSDPCLDTISAPREDVTSMRWSWRRLEEV